MTTEDLRSELEKSPFVPLRLHLSSGRTIDVMTDRSAFMLRHAVMVLQDSKLLGGDAGYNLLDVRSIEMIEQLTLGRAKRQRGAQ